MVGLKSGQGLREALTEESKKNYKDYCLNHEKFNIEWLEKEVLAEEGKYNYLYKIIEDRLINKIKSNFKKLWERTTSS